MTNKEKAKQIALNKQSGKANGFLDTYIISYESATEMAEWKEQESIEHSDIDFIKVCHFLLIHGIDLDMFDWRKMSFKYKEYIRKQSKENE